MSDWNPEHQAAADTWDRTTQQFAHVENLSADRRELTRRAAAIRKRDERIAELEKMLTEAICPACVDAGELEVRTQEGEWVLETCRWCCARAALAGKEEQK